MKYLKDNLLERITVAASWVFLLCTFLLGYLLAEVTF